ncbi:hypothetical protein PGB28_17580 [Primorskyibacter aestuariivivens]|uniref:hypothetical protein n=1 Tax=Primorskyibacter aestuariivivens TaxID=1888912 RepID=UPI0022FFEEB7|nr:hypothetical protein [Primorskyibacter aestuariivivens]MDA7430278.1 hypothetical protein [Primorskyibacter aestuariivivens]
MTEGRTNLLSFLKGASSFTFLFALLVIAKKMSLEIPTQHVDGAFQTASALYRINDGQFPGRDFFPYLGIGVTYLLYPTFLTLGENLSASVFSSYLFVFLSGWAATLSLVALIIKPPRFSSLAFTSAIVFAITFTLHSLVFSPFVADLISSPGASLRLVRALIPFIVALVIFWIDNRNLPERYQLVATGAAIGTSLIWSSDYAYTTALVFSSAALIVQIKRGLNDLFRRLAIVATSTMTFGAFLLSISTAGHPIRYLAYGFKDVAKDQWWYFGPYNAESKIFNLSDMSKIFTPDVLASTCVLLVSFVIWAWTRHDRLLLAASVGLVTFLSGLVASVGGHLDGYFDAFVFWASIAAITFTFNLVGALISKQLLSRPRPAFRLIGVASVFTLFFALAVGQYNSMAQRKDNLQLSSEMMYVSELGGYISTEWDDYINFARKNSEAPVIEEYWGILGAISTAKPLWKVDSVIHALGNVRDDAERQLDGAEYIVSSKFDASPVWQPWSVSQNFWFYGKLLREWSPVISSPRTIVWQKANINSRSLSLNCEIFNSGSKFRIPSGDAEYFRVNLQLGTRRPPTSRTLLFIRNNISFAPGSEGYVSVDPNATEVTIPVYRPERDSEFDLFSLGYDGDLHLTDCEYSPIYRSNPDYLRKGSRNALLITNGYWLNGVARNGYQFLLPDTEEDFIRFRPGNVVVMENGEKREIYRVQRRSGFLFVRVKGGKLDASEVGLPTNFKVLNIL